MHRAILLLTMLRETGGGVNNKMIYFSSRNLSFFNMKLISSVFFVGLS